MMKVSLRHPILFLVVLSVFICCQSNQDNKDLSENTQKEPETITRSPDEKEIIAAVEQLLVAVGNYNLEELDEMVSDKAMIGVSILRDGKWSNSERTIDEYFESVRNRKPTPYCEIVNDYKIMTSEGRLALVRADAVVHRFGIPQNREINHFTLMKENKDWKFLNVSFTVEPITEENRKFDLDIFARSYAQAWGSQRPEFVSSYFSEDGSLRVNDGEPAIGTEAIAKVAKGFMTDLPDMIVRYDSLVPTANGTKFHWTLIATNDGPGGTGNKVNVSGYELWQLDENGKIKSSQGHFSSEEYNRQIKAGINQ